MHVLRLNHDSNFFKNRGSLDFTMLYLNSISDKTFFTAMIDFGAILNDYLGCLMLSARISTLSSKGEWITALTSLKIYKRVHSTVSTVSVNKNMHI